MEALSQEDARAIANSFKILSSELGEYRFSNWDNLTEDERTKIESFEWSLLNHSSDITATAIDISTEDMQQYVSQIKLATDKLDGVLARIENVKQVMSIVTKTVTLAASISTGNLAAIKGATDGVFNELS